MIFHFKKLFFNFSVNEMIEAADLNGDGEVDYEGQKKSVLFFIFTIFDI